MDNRPQIITEDEWKQMASLPAVREAWGLEDDPDPLEFASRVYAARFNFVSGGPGYVGISTFSRETPSVKSLRWYCVGIVKAG